MQGTSDIHGKIANRKKDKGYCLPFVYLRISFKTILGLKHFGLDLDNFEAIRSREQI